MKASQIRESDVGSTAVFLQDGQVGKVTAVYSGGLVCEFTSNNGARFTARADEVSVVGDAYPSDQVAAVAVGRERALREMRAPFSADSGRTIFLLEAPRRRASPAPATGEAAQ